MSRAKKQEINKQEARFQEARNKILSEIESERQEARH